jgi:hypothetical protein
MGDTRHSMFTWHASWRGSWVGIRATVSKIFYSFHPQEDTSTCNRPVRVLLLLLKISAKHHGYKEALGLTSEAGCFPRQFSNLFVPVVTITGVMKLVWNFWRSQWKIYPPLIVDTNILLDILSSWQKKTKQQQRQTTPNTKIKNDKTTTAATKANSGSSLYCLFPPQCA